MWLMADINITLNSTYYFVDQNEGKIRSVIITCASTYYYHQWNKFSIKRSWLSLRLFSYRLEVDSSKKPNVLSKYLGQTFAPARRTSEPQAKIEEQDRHWTIDQTNKKQKTNKNQYSTSNGKPIYASHFATIPTEQDSRAVSCSNSNQSTLLCFTER